MPLISSRHNLGNGLVSVEDVKDKTIITHIENINPIAMACKGLRKNPDNGWAKKKGFRLIAKIPTIVFFDKKELSNPDGTINKKEFKKYMASPEGEIYKTVEGGI